jgi:hypothetical protein
MSRHLAVQNTSSSTSNDPEQPESIASTEVILELTSITAKGHRRGSTGTGRRRSSFDQANLSMVLPDKTHLAEDSTHDSIEEVPVSWFVWMVAFTASVAGSLFVRSFRPFSTE